MRGVPPRHHDVPGDGATRANLTAWSSRPGAAPGGNGGYRTRSVTGAAGRGSWARRRASARRTRRKLPHRQRRAPRTDPGCLRRVPPAALLPLSARACPGSNAAYRAGDHGRRPRLAAGTGSVRDPDGQYRARYGGRYRRLPDPVPARPKRSLARSRYRTGYGYSSRRARLNYRRLRRSCPPDDGSHKTSLT